MLMSYQKKEAIDLIKFRHDFTKSDAEKIKDELDYIICRGNAKLMIDLSELHSIDANAVGLLFYCAQKAKKRNGGLVLYKPHLNILSMFKMAQFENAFEVFFSNKSAVQALG